MKKLSLIAAAILAAGWTATAAGTNGGGDTGQNRMAGAIVPRAIPETITGQDAPLSDEAAPADGLILNFHEVPLNAVLNYLSARAGLIVMSDVDLRGKVSIVAKQPITTNEIVGVLSAQLTRNNYAVALTGRTLTIMDVDRARTSALTPVIANHSGPKEIPVNDQVVTEILPIHALQPDQLANDLKPLIPAGASISANDAGHAIVMTAPQKDVHRVSEIIAALDSSVISDVEVFILQYADATAVASELKEVFQTADSNTSGGNGRSSFGGPGGPGGPGGGMFPGFPDGGGSEENTKNAQTHAVFVADNKMNAVVASVPPDSLRTVSNLIAKLDRPSQEVTEIHVMRLKHADPSEVADELSSLFPSSNASSGQDNRSMGFQFDPLPQATPGDSSQNTRMKRQSTVLAVADRRTQSIMVTASKGMMEQIKRVVQDLDQGSLGVQKVTVLDFGGADPAAVDETMSGLFSSATSRANSSTLSATPLANRYSGNANSQSSASSTAASSEAGGSGSTGAR